MIYHIVTGDLAANQLAQAVEQEPLMQGNIVIIRDVLSVGPLLKAEGQKFSELRSEFWQDVVGGDKLPVQVDDLERLLQTGNELSQRESDRIWLWVAPIPADACTYFWAVKYLGKYAGRISVVNIEGLPFLDEQGKLFFPKSIAELHPKELVKARKLARLVSPAEIEADSDEWQQLVNENAGIRTQQGGKKLISRPESYYDAQLMSFCSQQYQKASRIVGQALAKFNIPTGDLYLGWRLRKLAESGRLLLQGDAGKALKDFEVRLPGDGDQLTIQL